MISIIGAGPAGSYSAYLLAKSGHEVNVYEEHKKIGDPIQCSGVITPALDSLLKIKKEIIVNKIKKFRFYSPNDKSFEVGIKPDYVFDRGELDRYIASLAEKSGARFINKRFIDMGRNDGKIKLKFNDGFSETDKLIGADGPYSQVAKSAGLFGNRKYITGMQARCKIPEHDKYVTDIFLGYGEFAWLIPENENVARIGLVSEKNPSEEFKRLINRCNAKLINYQSGMIPLYNSKLKTEKKNVYLIGDAATMVKASSHGGIAFSMIAGQCLSKSINENKSYEKLWKKELGFNLYLHLKIRNTLLKFNNEDYNKLVEYFSQEKLKKVLSSHVRDFPSRFLVSMLMKEPRLLRYSLKAL